MTNEQDNKGYRFNRRRFVGSALLAGALAEAQAQTEKKVQSAGAAIKGAGCQAAGLLAERVGLTAQRLLSGQIPEFSREFVLADVALAPERRFNEYSGDLSGRYIGALALLPARQSGQRLEAVVKELIGHQRPDGRFGDAHLVFKADQIGPKHMALLWGNGRLLVGLLEYYEASRDQKVLETARRLGRFLLAVREDCSEPSVLRRLEGQGASGYICFTQLIEGLVLLKRATGDVTLLKAASSIVPLLQPRGIQHAHGYLCTLRGILMLYEETKEPGHLAFVEDAYRDLVRSPDFTEFGSVLEYFGWKSSGRSDADRSTIAQASGKEARDEGCGHADFLRLSLALWKQTGKLEYLERAESCLWNAFYLNQFRSGDFGHHVCSGPGVKPTDNLARAWWCCTMHGYRAFPDLLGGVVTGTGQEIRVNLYEEVDWSDGANVLKLRRAPRGARPGEWRFSIDVNQAAIRSAVFALRLPRWADEVGVLVNGQPVAIQSQEGYGKIERAWRPGDRIELRLGCRLVFRREDGTTFPAEQLTAKPVQASLMLGPWLMGVDSVREPLFFGEPWQGNVVHLGKSAAVTPLSADSADPSIGLVLPASYVHGGFTGQHSLKMRPVADAYRHDNAIVAVWLRFG